VSLAAVAKSSAWSWTGGVFGTIYIVVSILLLPHLGAATVVALLVTGQMLGSLVFDHYGLFGLTPHSLDIFRLAGATLLIVGVVLIRHLETARGKTIHSTFRLSLRTSVPHFVSSLSISLA
jgi:bacterial/archaeal transporter family-2 protein